MLLTRLLLCLVVLLSLALPVQSQIRRTMLAREDLNIRTPIVDTATLCTQAALQTLLTAIGATDTTVLLPAVNGAGTACTWAMTSNLTIPSNVVLMMPFGTRLVVSVGVTLTLTHCPIADAYQVFEADGSITGAVRLAPGGRCDQGLWAAWWGAKADGTTDSTTAINQGVLAANSRNGGCVQLDAGRYRITDTLQVVGDASGSVYPDVLVIDVGLCGAGANATFIEWNSALVMDAVRKAMVYFGGNHARLENLTLLSPRVYGSLIGAFASYNTPYYGIVIAPAGGSTWKNSIRNVNVRFVHVPLSAGIIKTFKTAGDGLEFEPTAGGSALSVDFAQLSIENSWFTAQTHELSDGTWVASAKNNLNGTNLSKGVGHTTDLTGAVFSDGSYAMELGTQQLVAFTCHACTLDQQNRNVNSTVRLHDAGQVVFTGTTFFAPPPNSDFSYSFFENIGSGGSHATLTDCYFIGGIYIGSTSAGALAIVNGDGENDGTTAFGGNVRLFQPLNGAWGATSLSVRGLRVGRGSQTKQIRLSGATQGANPVAPGGQTSAFVSPTHRFRFENIEAVNDLLVGHESIGSNVMSRFNPALNVLPNVPAILRGKAVAPTFLDPAQYDQIPGAGAGGFASAGEYHHGVWHLIGTVGATHVFAALAPINPDTAYTVCVNVYVLMNGGMTIADLNNEASYVVRFYDSSKAATGTAMSMLGSFTATHNYSLLSDGNTIRLCNYHIAPPTGAAYIGVTATAAPNVARTQKVGFGNMHVFPAPAEEVVDGTMAAPRFAADAAPATGTWDTNDIVERKPAVVGQPTRWKCTIAGVGCPAGWISEGNL